MAKKTRKRIVLSPAQQAQLADGLHQMIRETREAYAEFEDMTLEEWRALKEWWRRKPRGRGPTEYPDPYLWHLMQQVLLKARTDAKPIGHQVAWETAQA